MSREASAPRQSTRGRIGIREVADRAGVSIGTVSNTLNHPSVVSEATQTRVRDAIAALGFTRNELARQLRSGQSRTLGMLVLDVGNPFFGALANACEQAAEEHGLTIMLGSSNSDPEREERYLDLFERQQVGGLLIAPTAGATEQMQSLHRAGTPMVLFDPNADPERFCTVAMDGTAGAVLAAEHLIATGRRRIAFVAASAYLLEDRWTGAGSVAARHPEVSLSRVEVADLTFATGEQAGRRLAELPDGERPDAVIAGTDQLAIGLMRGFLADGRLRVPDDLAVVGYDDIEFAGAAVVPLTTIAQPVDEIARTALSLIIAETDDAEHAHSSVTVAPTLRLRDSA